MRKWIVDAVSSALAWLHGVRPITLRRARRMEWEAGRAGESRAEIRLREEIARSRHEVECIERALLDVADLRISSEYDRVRFDNTLNVLVRVNGDILCVAPLGAAREYIAAKVAARVRREIECVHILGRGPRPAQRVRNDDPGALIPPDFRPGAGTVPR